MVLCMMEEEDIGKKSRRVVLRLLGIMYDLRAKWEKKLEHVLGRYASQRDYKEKPTSLNLEDTFLDIKDIVLSQFADFHSELSKSVVKYVQALIEKYVSTIEDLKRRVEALDTHGNVVEDLRKEVEVLREKTAKLQEFIKRELTKNVKYRILTVLEESGSLTTRDLVEKLKVSEGQVRKCLRELKSERFVEMKKDVRPYVIILLKTPWST